MLQSKNPGKWRLLAPALLLALGACSGKQDEPAAKPAATAAAPAASAPATPAPAAEPAISTKVQAMGTGELREAATQALRDNRMYAPAGDNAVEYYLALRDKQPDDASVKSALTDLMPYALIAAEQNINREDFPEAQRLIALIEKVDADAPALPRLRQGVGSGRQAVADRTQSETERLRKAADDKARQLAEQQRQAQQQASEAQAAQQIAAQQEAARQAAARQQAERAEAERQAAARREQAAPRPAAVAAPPTLRPISTPAPRYPAEALRSGTSGEVLVEITVGTDGSVTNARVLRATPARVFDREALNAAKRWRFEPVPAPVTTRRTLAFNPGN
ncbi:energy transducer TonB [Stenotrophomonas sp. MMGLT7]|uniref:energy transducer TonB n=1 Tax=Stenotrophomonas sp. MMGLT7 TaxID=2901227 RepID=UPI001E349037|nr:energy transducer TonB [Stenotrophomonas sp. MMGLT7]MCD7099043.1 energy transducer TonB [Stenotrophomonas sp. MMGLT7]